MIIKIIGAFIAIVGFSIKIKVPKQYIAYTGGVAAIGWFIFLLIQELGESVYVATFLSAIVISILAQTMARIKKTPVTIFNIPGIMPLVPGTGMYMIVYYVMEGNNEMVSFYLIQTMQIAGLISIAIFISEGVFNLIFRLGKEKVLVEK